MKITINTINIFFKKPAFWLITFLFLSFSLNCTGKVNDSSILVYKQNKGFFSYENEDFDKIVTSLPSDLIPVKIERSDSGKIYLASQKSGVWKSNNNYEEWENISIEDFKRRTVIKNNHEYRKISALHADKKGKLLLATKHRLYSSNNEGKSWKKESLKGLTDWKNINSLQTDINGSIIVGTAKHSIYIRKNGRFRKMKNGLPEEPVSKTYSFFEAVSDLHRDGKNLYAGFYFGKGIFISNNNGKSWKNLNFPLKNKALTAVYDIKTTDSLIYAATGEGLFYSNKNQISWKKHTINKTISKIFSNPENRAIFLKIDNNYFYLKNEASSKLLYKIQSTKADGKTAVYTNIHKLKKNINYFIKLSKSTGINSVVIDVKDDTGYIYFPVKNSYAKKIGAVRKAPDWKTILKTFHDNNIYVIARFVVFKDNKLYKAENSKYSIKDKRNNRPWKGLPHEYWCDPFSEFVQNYNLELAKEISDAGFDEIQFDYIRFPADGGVLNCKYTYGNADDKFKSEVLADFLQRAQNIISKPISADIYGFNAFYVFGNIIGQDVEVFSEYVDAVSPMVYPSHYGSRFFKKGLRSERPYRIVYANTLRARYLSNYQVRMRPYIQAFNLLSPTWGTGYIKNELKAINDSKANGYIFWNASGDYSTVIKAMKSNSK